MHKHNIIYLTSIALTLPASVAAQTQELNKEITIEKQMLPEVRIAGRMNLMPNVVNAKVSMPDINFADSSFEAPLSPRFNQLGAVGTTDALPASTQRGYAGLAYFPAYNLDISAGYRFIANDRTLLRAFAQFDGVSYNTAMTSNWDDRVKVIQNDLTVGADLTHMFNSWQRLDVGATFNFATTQWPILTGIPYPVIPGKERDNVSSGSLNAQWHSGSSETRFYDVTASAGMFVFSNAKVDTSHPDANAVTELNGSLGFGLNYDQFDATVSADIVRFNHNIRPDSRLNNGNSWSYADITLAPHFATSTENFDMKLGLKMTFGANAESKFSIAPDVMLSYNPIERVNASVELTGGVIQNHLADLFRECRFMNPYVSYADSRVPLDALLRLSFVPVNNLNLGIFGGYSVARNWLMPVNNKGYDSTVFEPEKIKGWRGGASVSYTWRKLAGCELSVAVASGDKRNSGYYLWRDRARCVADIQLWCAPIERLRIEAGWQLRTDRCVWHEQLGFMSSAGTTDVKTSLGNVNRLNLGASYRLLPDKRLQLFARAYNILNHRAMRLGEIQEQGATALVGAIITF